MATRPGPVTSEDLLRLADDASLRWITDERQLHDVVREALTRFQSTLHGPDGAIVALWNRDQPGAGHRKRWPCWEEDLNDILASFLRQDIGGNRVIINREVQLRRSGLPGQRADIPVEATAPQGTRDEPTKVIIECKGCWNASLAIASPACTAWLTAHGAVTIPHGDQLAADLSTAAPHGIDAFIDLFGPQYVQIAVDLGIPPDRIETIISFEKAAQYGTRNAGSADGSTREVLTEMAAHAASGRIKLPIAATYPLHRVRDAFATLEQRHTHGKIALIP